MHCSYNDSVKHPHLNHAVVSWNFRHKMLDFPNWTLLNLEFHGWSLPGWMQIIKEKNTQILIHLICLTLWFTCSACISFSFNLVLKISLVIFSCNSNKCSVLNPGELLSTRVGGIGVVALLVSFWSNFSSSTFGGTEITPRCERFRSFSRMSMNCWENLHEKNLKKQNPWKKNAKIYENRAQKLNYKFFGIHRTVHLTGNSPSGKKAATPFPTVSSEFNRVIQQFIAHQ